MIELTLPLPPTVNHAYGQRGKVRYLRKGYKIFKHEVAVIVANENARGHFPRPKRVGVAVVLHMTGRGDIDNRVKPLLDALEEAHVFENDSQVGELKVTRGYPVKGGRCHVTIWEV